jgi:hypothetical protein
MCEQAPKFHTGVYIIVAGMLRESRAGLLCHSGARAEFANPESRRELGVFIWIPGPRLRRVPE